MLTPEQIRALDQHLRKENWLLNEELIAELTDHYRAGLEDRLGQGVKFDAALRDIHMGFGGRTGLLKMEEEYKVQKYRQFSLMKWHIIRSFLSGFRWPITVGVFAGLYLLNTFSEQKELVKMVLNMGSFLVTMSVMGNLLGSILIFYQNRHEVNRAILEPGSSVSITTYCLSLLLLRVSEFQFSRYDLGFPAAVNPLLDTVLETLYLVYYAACALAIRQILLNNRRAHRLTKAS